MVSVSHVDCGPKGIATQWLFVMFVAGPAHDPTTPAHVPYVPPEQVPKLTAAKVPTASQYGSTSTWSLGGNGLRSHTYRSFKTNVSTNPFGIRIQSHLSIERESESESEGGGVGKHLVHRSRGPEQGRTHAINALDHILGDKTWSGSSHWPSWHVFRRICWWCGTGMIRITIRV